MHSRFFLMLAAGLAAGLTGCEPSLEDAPAPSAAAVNFSKYVAVGDNYTAGVYNGSLTRASQEYAFPNLFAQQLQRAGGGSFSQPQLESADIMGDGVRLLSLTTLNLPLLGPVTPTSVDTVRFGVGPCSELRYKYPDWNGAATGLPQNLGAPGLRLQDVSVVGAGNVDNRPSGVYNTALDRILPAGDNRTYLDLLKDSRPTFFTVSIGISNILPYLRSGGTCGSPLLSSGDMLNHLSAVVDSLLKTGAKGVVYDVPDPRFALPLTQMTLTKINRQLGRLDTASLYLTVSGTKTRLLRDDVVLLPIVSRLGLNVTPDGQVASAPLGTINNPLRDQDVLTSAEMRTVGSSIGSLNAALAARYKKSASGGRTIVVSLGNNLQTIINTKLLQDGILYSGDVVTGGVFSMDGVSLTPRGNALLTNWTIDDMNDEDSGFGTHIPKLDVSQYPATPLP